MIEKEDIFIYILGFAAQGLFSARVLVQWIKSEKAGEVINPPSFWILSLAASYLFFIYGWLRNDFPIMLGQVIGYYVYIWNIRKMRIFSSISSTFRYILHALMAATPPVLTALFLFHHHDTVIHQLFESKDIPSFLIILGCTGQVIFSLRFLYQMIYSSVNGVSLLPKGFWILSLTGSSIIIIYGIIRLDPVVIIGQTCGFTSYTRQLILCQKKNLR